MTVTLGRNVEAFIGTTRRLFINGRWADAASGKTFETPNPATGETLARVAEGDAEDINRAVQTARAAFDDGPWSRMTPSERGRIVWRIGDLILEHVDELAQRETAGAALAAHDDVDSSAADMALASLIPAIQQRIAVKGGESERTAAYDSRRRNVLGRHFQICQYKFLGARCRSRKPDQPRSLCR